MMVTHGFAVHSSIAIQFSIRIFHINRARTGRQSGGSSQPSVVHAHIFNPHTADGPAIPRLQTWEETWTERAPCDVAFGSSLVVETGLPL